ncbi:FtsX-like permease family protein [Paenibacillus sp. R14(2021)]|uniref:FtsX-like permease family protein n=1 Tax=Paenibacillus sp. R14(2021) TaxID=2859228 RepID=UPI001C616B5D|nr:ABC transporter permease [Paenibacillus sp. R14(2021)]
MSFRQFAILNVLRNKRVYLAYFLSSAFSVMIFFTYALLLFHPDLQGELVASHDTLSLLGTMGMKVSEVIIFVFSFFFLLYSVGAFLKLRKKEFGILILLGMSRKQLNRMLFVENASIGLAAVVFGIGLGLVFSKLILLVCAKLLAIDHGLRFYVPLNAIWLTLAAFAMLFLVIASLTSKMAGKEKVAALIQSEDRPKPEPTASLGLSVLAIVLIAAGYWLEFDFAIHHHFTPQQLLGGVVLAIAGTYVLFRQTSIYVLRALRKNKLFYRRTNMLTLAELTYRMKDNATMFFIVSVISAMAFTGIGTTLAIGDPGLASMSNPYAFSYFYTASNVDAAQKLKAIENELTHAGYAFQAGPVSALPTENGLTLVKLSEYNRLAAALGYKTEKLSNDSEMFATPSYIWQKSDYEKDGTPTGTVELTNGKSKATAEFIRYIPTIVLPGIGYGGTAVVTDSLYSKLLAGYEDRANLPTTVQIVVKDWKTTGELSQQLQESIQNDAAADDYLRSLSLEWIASRQQNGMLLIVSGLVGIVFFTFAASFLYFRLYADLERDEKQYGMIAKVGLSSKELSRILTRQLFIMFFVPLAMALFHSTIAFIALQQLVDFSILANSLEIFGSFVFIQLVYFLIARWRSIEHLKHQLS